MVADAIPHASSPGPRGTARTLPPTPRIPPSIQTALFLKRPFPFVDYCRRRCGDVYRLRLRGFGEIVYIADIGAIREVFAADGEAAHAGEANALIEHVTGSQSILTLDRDEHLRERRLISPALHGQALTSAQREIARIAIEELATWPTDRAFALRPALQRLTFRVIANLLLGREDPETQARLLGLLEPVFNSIPLAILPPVLRRDAGPLSPWGRFARARRRLDRELSRIIAERRAAPPGSDLLGLLVHGPGTGPGTGTGTGSIPVHGGAGAEQPRSEEQARDELLTLLLAGHETSATALSWSFERLARNPQALARAHQAATGGGGRYLDAVIEETLRVRPVVMDVARVLDQPLTLAGYRLPAGTTVLPAIYLVHTDERHHHDARAFAPERYLHTKPDPLTWLPFGGGRRRCAGAAFAQLEIRTVLQTVLTHRTLRAANLAPERPVLRGLTFTPQHDALLELPPRAKCVLANVWVQA